MGKKLEFLAFWAINDELLTDRACAQLDEMKRLGLTGVIFHPRNYTGKPEYLGQKYMELLSEIILYAKKLGLSFWLYDENGYPSGTASGKVLAENPSAKCMWLVYQGGKVVCQEKNAVSTLDKKVCRDFIRITFDGYQQGLKEEAFAYVSGVFSDEVGFLDGSNVSLKYGGVPWCEDMQERYQAKYGESIEDKLPLLFEDKEGYQQVRERYWELVTQILRENFYQPIHAWCARNHKKYTAHLKGEENIFFNLAYNGSPYQILKAVSVPAIDALERYPGNHYYPHIASSIARQFYDGSCLCEAMGGSGWGVSPKDFVAYMKWLVECGVNIFTFHLAQYNLKAQAIRDWPPSVPFHLSWKEAFSEALERIREYKEEVDESESGRERVLLVAPTRGCMREFVPDETAGINEHNGANVPDTTSGKISSAFGEMVERCYQNGILYDVTEEKILEEDAQFEEDGVRIGNMRYRNVIFGEGCCFHDQKWEQRRKEFQTEHKRTNVLPEGEAEGKKRNPDYRLLGEDVTEWKILEDKENQCLLELTKEGSTGGHCSIVFGQVQDLQDMHLVISDPVEWVKVNGHRITGSRTQGAWESYPVPAEQAKEESGGSQVLRIEVQTLEDGEKAPFLFLRGKFLVKSGRGYEEKEMLSGRSHREKGEAKQLYTQGDFFLTSDFGGVRPDALVQSGFPFRERPVLLEKKVQIPKDADYLSLSAFDGAAVRLRIGEEAPVWVFCADEYIRLPRKRDGGECLLRAELYPSTYNMYGPHHHMDGDRYLVSPAQYSGEKNFADASDSPPNTLVSGFHFVKLGLVANVGFFKKC